MVKKWLGLPLAVLLTASALSACGSKSNDEGAASPSASAPASSQAASPSGDGGAPVTIKMFTASPEYTDAFHAYIEEYKKVKPNVTIELEIMQADYPTVLKSRIASGNTPDVFQTTAGGEIKQYAEYSADLTNEPLAAAMTDAVKANMSADGKVLGLPVKGNLFTLIYNKKLFADAGITEVPKTMSQLKDAVAKLEAKGITPFANGYKEWWVQKHIMQHFLSAAAGHNAAQLVADFQQGKTTFKDHPILMNYFDFVDLTVQHGMPKPLERDLNAEITDFATGKAAIMTGQGAWVEEGISKIDPNLQIGIMGYPVDDNPDDARIITGADQALRINKDSKVVKETIEFFNWLYTSDYGKNWFANVAKVIPPIKDGTMPNLQMPKAMEEYFKAGGKSGDLAVNYSLDSFHQKLGEIMQAYIGKNKTKDQAIDEIQKAWIQLGAAK
ncbi:extracellular solute-binding protein [Cohnella sp. CFH 77786]|uniref:ABC transporter substrate-binding protein n=1 Tax=Cohnella sp. CFH 77786 TaxID=2662265 RepID=UPI001C60FD45|nr:extracellular solute-binding protein [Cohnella sp. CFH 77786]MBW5449419.1 extracellular solute-binding protein [Cohnella sp. CFH 77786]